MRRVDSPSATIENDDLWTALLVLEELRESRSGDYVALGEEGHMLKSPADGTAIVSLNRMWTVSMPRREGSGKIIKEFLDGGSLVPIKAH